MPEAAGVATTSARAPRNLPPPDEFERFWNAYPLRVARPKAVEALRRALKISSWAEIEAGLERYKQTKPAWANWAYPATWLNQQRWMDETPGNSTTTPMPGSGRRWQWEDCPHSPHCGSATKCQITTQLEEARKTR